MSNKLTKNELHADIVQELDNVQVVKESLVTHESDDISHVRYGIATGLNTITMTLSPAPKNLVEGMALSFKNATTNTAAVTLNVNGLGAKPIVKSNGFAVTSGSLKANSIYTVRYNGMSFFLQGEGGEYGTAIASDVLTGKTIGTEIGLVAGTMPNIGSVGAQTLTTQNQSYIIPAGLHNGSGSVKATYPAAIIIPPSPAVRVAVNQTLNSVSVVGTRTLTAYSYTSACKMITFDQSFTYNGYGIGASADYNFTGQSGIVNGLVQARVYLLARATGSTYNIVNASVSQTGSLSQYWEHSLNFIVDGANSMLITKNTSPVRYTNVNLSAGFDIVLYTYSDNNNYTPSPKAVCNGNINIYT